MISMRSKKLAALFFAIGIFQVSCSDPGSLGAINSASADRRNIVGIEISTPSAEQKALTGCGEGIYVSAVIPNHPAETAGLKTGDMITHINSQQVDDIPAGLMALSNLEAGIKYPFKICRKTPQGTVGMEKHVLVEKVQEKAIGKIS